MSLMNGGYTSVLVVMKPLCLSDDLQAIDDFHDYLWSASQEVVKATRNEIMENVTSNLNLLVIKSLEKIVTANKGIQAMY